MKTFSLLEHNVLKNMLLKRLQSPLTSSVGRLFDVISALLGVCEINRFEGQAAMELEFLIGDTDTDVSYPFEVLFSPDQEPEYLVNWEPIVNGILQDKGLKISKPVIAAKFHNTLAQVILAIAERLKKERIILSGGCFQNKYLTERTITVLKRKGFRPYWHQRIPPNDGSISLGQIVGAAHLLRQAAHDKIQNASDHIEADLIRSC